MRLVVGDRHRLFADSLAAVLAEHGVEVVAFATSPQETLGCVARLHPDVCLLAARFPASSGLDVMRVIGERHPGVKVVLFSASPEPGVMAAAQRAGAAGFIPSDHHVADIVSALVRVRDGERVFDMMLAGVRRFRPAADAERSPPSRPWDRLTSREQEVLLLMMDGEATRQIARSLAISVSTARTHVENVLGKLGVHSRLEATTVAARSGLPTSGQPRSGLPRSGLSRSGLPRSGQPAFSLPAGRVARPR